MANYKFGNYTISPVSGKDATLDDLKQFAAVPFFIPWYRTPESNKVFPWFLNEIGEINPSERLIPKAFGNNPFFEHSWITIYLARKGNRPVGRIAVFGDSRYDQEHGDTTGWLGMFECVEDPKLARDLLSLACDNLHGANCHTAVGPAKYNANGEVGLLVDGFSKKPYFMESYNAPYYGQFFEDAGFAKLNDWCSIQVDTRENTRIFDYMRRVEQLKARAMQSKDERSRLIRETSIRHMRFADFEQEKQIIKSLYNSEWGKGNHPQFVSMTDPEFNNLASGIKLIALEELILVAEHGGKPIGVAVTVPNINEVISEYDAARPGYLPSDRFLSPMDLKRDIAILGGINARKKSKSFDTARVLILGVTEEYRSHGIDALLYYESFKAAEKLGIKAASFSELADINQDILLPLKKMGDVAMTWRVYSQTV